MGRVMWKQKTELSEVDSPEFDGGNTTNLDPATELPAPTAEEELEAEPTKAASSEVAPEQSELEQLKAERDRLLDRLARLQAEFENARKRAERERSEYREFAAGAAAEQFLPVLDNLELALKAQGSAEQLRSGVSLIVKQMEEILEKMQVKVVPTVGEAFDPRFHEALGTVERDDVPDQHVVEEVRRGYKIRERLLRPALVRVAHNVKQVNE
ncbi:MAG TPA: nucleotide exchange factor GrpE [Terracidiphilus sp.]|nr:nucleotide exchange factor GrpE [Terracidiphilus sp.]